LIEAVLADKFFQGFRKGLRKIEFVNVHLDNSFLKPEEYNKRIDPSKWVVVTATPPHLIEGSKKRQRTQTKTKGNPKKRRVQSAEVNFIDNRKQIPNNEDWSAESPTKARLGFAGV
jgi:hypothetical protein